MTAPAPRTPLGASVREGRWYVDVNTGTKVAPVWTPVNGLTECKVSYTPTMQDVTDFDSNGAKSSQATAYEWGIEFKCRRGVKAGTPTEYDAGQEAIRLAAQQIGLGNIIEVRAYEMEPNGPRVEAYQGNVSAGWEPDGGSMETASTVTCNLAGNGARQSIVHPDAPVTP